MKNLDHIDMAVMAGAVPTIASAVFLFAYLGIEREPAAPQSPKALLQQEVNTAISEVVALPARAMMEQAQTQAALGKAILDLTRAKARVEAFIPSLVKRANAGAQTSGQAIAGAVRSAERRAEERYGRAVIAAMAATERERSALAFAASLRDRVAAGTSGVGHLAERAAPKAMPVVTREPAWGFGSIGDGAVLPIMIIGGSLLLCVAGYFDLTETRLATRTFDTHCDLFQKDVVVEVLASGDVPYVVARCSAFDGGPVTCDQHCLNREMAHAA